MFRDVGSPARTPTPALSGDIGGPWPAEGLPIQSACTMQFAGAVLQRTHPVAGAY